jgi:hypothetical protein
MPQPIAVMKLFRARPAYPKDGDLVRIVQAAARRLAEKIEKMDAASLDLSAGTRRLFERGGVNLRPYIERCAQVFAWSLPRNERPFTDLALLAFNDGIGVFSLLAKECSIGKVVYHDANDVVRCDARAIARAIGQTADHYVFGDTEEVEFVLTRHAIACDVFVSSNPLGAPTRASAPRALAAFLSAICEQSTGALSLALALEERSLRRLSGPLRANDIDSLSRELAGAGFETKIVRSIDRSSGTVVLAGSRPAEARALIEARPTAATEPVEPRLSMSARESR